MILKPRQTKYIEKRNIAVVDIETELIQKPGQKPKEVCRYEHQFKFGYLLYYDRYQKIDTYYFDSKQAFFEIIEKLQKTKQCLYLYGHNINYDLSVLNAYQYFNNHNYSCKKAVVDNQIFYLWLKNTNKCSHLKIVDTFNYIRASLETISKMFNLAEKISYDFYSEKNNNKLRQRCLNDCKITLEFVLLLEKLFKSLDTPIGTTISSSALNLYLNKYYNNNIYIHSNYSAIELERNAYYGGRTECFRLGKFNNIYQLDINSAYPYVMTKFKYPTKLRFYNRQSCLRNIKYYLDNGFAVIAKVKVNTDKPYYPCRDKRLLFPTGQFTTYLTTNELKLAIEHNHIVDSYEYAVYEQDYIFVDYVKELYKLRQQANDNGTKMIYKLLLNSLYGKFGQKNSRYIDTKIPTEIFTENEYFKLTDYYDNGKMLTVRKILDKIQVKSDTVENAKNAFVAIAASVTANCRLLLLKYIIQAGFDNIYYCDTDSLFVNEVGYQRLVYNISDKLGDLKLEKIIKDLNIVNLKWYSADNVTKIKSIKKNANKIYEDDNKAIYEQIQFPSILHHFHENLDIYYTPIIKKELNKTYSKNLTIEHF